MSHRILPGIVALASIPLVSCYPYPEQDPYYDVPPQGYGYHGVQPSITSPQQQEIERQREQARREEERKRRQQEAESKPRETAQPGTTTGSQPRETSKPSPETKPSTDYPFATPVVGQEGFVLSPYNQKKVDVRGIQTGTLVRDPTYPAAEKKYFRVP